MHTQGLKIWLSFVLLMGLIPGYAHMAAAKDFVVVLDAGHGGHDAGAVGRISKEKNINLKVALEVGRMLERNCPDVRVVYTRKTDKFIPLHGRADIANHAKADLFVSIHTNSLPKGKIARGTETYTLGLHRTKENLAVAQKENSVILIESDYKQRYAGFNPNSAESYIMFEFIQDKNMKQSLRLARNIQRQFRTIARRNDRGVRQAGFLVLHATSMPSVLVELGYISTPDEEQYLNSPDGVSALGRSIYRAIVDYKEGVHPDEKKGDTSYIPSEDATQEETNDVQTETQPTPETDRDSQPEKDIYPAVTRRKASVETTAPTKDTESNTPDSPVFKIQIIATPYKLKTGDRRLKGLSPVDYYKEGNTYKYTYAASTDYNQVYRLRKEVAIKFKDAFIIAFKNGQKMDVQQAIQEFKNNKKKK